jgi:hypothetical protein
MTRLPVLPSSMHKPWAGSESYKISGLDTVHGWTASPVHSASLPFCVRFNAAVARRAATLDTGPVASSYPRGVSTRLSTNHFQSARASDGSIPSCLCVLKVVPINAKLTNGGVDGSEFQVFAAPIGDHSSALRFGIEPFPMRSTTPSWQLAAGQRHQLPGYFAICHGAMTKVSNQTGLLASRITAFPGKLWPMSS